MAPRMIDIVVNNQLVAVVAENFSKMFVSMLIAELPTEMSIATYVHYEDYGAQDMTFTPEPNIMQEVGAADEN
jgi:hypothetical protein